MGANFKIMAKILKQWTAKQCFRDINNFNIVYKVGDVVEHTELREELQLIELK